MARAMNSHLHLRLFPDGTLIAFRVLALPLRSHVTLRNSYSYTQLGADNQGRWDFYVRRSPA